MKHYLNDETLLMLTRSEFFGGIELTELRSLLICLLGRIKAYEKKEIILHAGQPVTAACIILEGSVQIYTESEDGNRTVIGAAKRGEMFAEALLCAGIEESPVSVVAAENTAVLFIGLNKIITQCSSACAFHVRLTENLLKIMAQKNLYLQQRGRILAKKTTREKLLEYFKEAGKGKKVFTIQFTQSELADYLCLNRSAMSREISKMRDDGIINLEGKKVRLI